MASLEIQKNLHTEYFWISVRKQLLDNDDRTEKWCIIVMDIIKLHIHSDTSKYN
jgi:hypothetical protein